MFSFSATNQKSEDNKRPLLTFVPCCGKRGFSNEYIPPQNLQSKWQRKESSHDDQNSINIRRSHQKTSKQEVINSNISESSLRSTEFPINSRNSLEKIIFKRLENKPKSRRFIDDLQQRVHSQVSIVEETNNKRTFSEEAHKYRVAIPEPWKKRASKPFRSSTTGENKQSKHLFSREATAEPILLSKFKDELHVNPQTDKQRHKLLRRVPSRLESTRHGHVLNVKDELHNQETDHEPRKEMDGKPSSPCTNSRKEHFQDVLSKHGTARHVDVLVLNKHHHKHQDTIREPEQEIDTTQSIFFTRKGNEPWNEVPFRSKLKEKLCGNQDTDLESQEEMDVKPSGALIRSVKEPSQDIFARHGTPKQVDLRKSKKDRSNDTITELRKDVDITPSSSTTRSRNELYSHKLTSHALLCQCKDDLHTLKKELNKCQNTHTKSRKELDRTPYSSPTNCESELSRQEPSGHLCNFKEEHRNYQGTDLETRKEINGKPSSFSTSSAKRPQDVFPRHVKSIFNKGQHQDVIQEPRKEIDRKLSSTLIRSENEPCTYVFSRHEPLRCVPVPKFKYKLRGYHDTDLESQEEMYWKSSSSLTRSVRAPSQEVFSRHEMARHEDLQKLKKDRHKYQVTMAEVQKDISQSSSPTKSGNKSYSNVLSSQESLRHVLLRKYKDELLKIQDTALELQEKIDKRLCCRGKNFCRHVLSRHDFSSDTPSRHLHNILTKKIPSNHTARNNARRISRLENARKFNLLSRNVPSRTFNDDKLDTCAQPPKEMDKTPFSSATCIRNELSGHEYSVSVSSRHTPLSKFSRTEMLHECLGKVTESPTGIAKIPPNFSTKIKNDLCRGVFSKSRLPRHVSLKKRKKEKYLDTPSQITVTESRKETDGTPFSSRTQSENALSRLESSINEPLCKLDRDALRLYQNINLDAQNKVNEMPSTSPASSKNELSEYSLKYQSLCKYKDGLRKHHYKVSEPQKEMNETSSICLTRCENGLSMHKSPTYESMYKFKDVLSNQDTDIQPQKKMYETSSTSPMKSKTDSRRDGLLCKFKDELSKYHDIDHEPQKEIDDAPSSCHTRSKQKLFRRSSLIRVILHKFKDYLLKYRNQVLEPQKQNNGTPYSSLAKTKNTSSKHAISTHESQSNAFIQHVPLYKFKDDLLRSSIKIGKVPFRCDFQRKLNFPSRHVPIRKSKDELCTYQNVNVPHPRKELPRTPFNSFEKIKHVVSRYDPSKYALSRALYSGKRNNNLLNYQSTITQRRKQLIRTSSKPPVTDVKINSKPRHVHFQIIHKKGEDASKTASDIPQTTRIKHSTLPIMNNVNIKIDKNQEYNEG